MDPLGLSGDRARARFTSTSAFATSAGSGPPTTSPSCDCRGADGLDPQSTTQSTDPKDLYLATTAELSRRFTRIYTALGPQDPLYRRFCRYRERDFRESHVV